MAGTIALTPFCLATSASGVNATLPNGTVVLRTPTLPPAFLNESAVAMAARLEEGEIPYPYEASTVPPWALRKLPICVLTGYFGSTLPSSEANMLV